MKEGSVADLIVCLLSDPKVCSSNLGIVDFFLAEALDLHKISRKMQ
jgi:hypothetical protein